MSNVLPFIDPYRERLAQVRSWFADQANEPEGHVAGLTIAVTGSGALSVKGCTIEPSHAQMMLDKLDAIRKRLETIAVGEAPVSRQVRSQCQVIQLRPRAPIRAQA